MPCINGKFYMNPAYGRGVESARNAEAATQQDEVETRDQDAHWVTIAGRHVLIQEGKAGPNKEESAPKRQNHPEVRPLPSSGRASIYADSFQGKKTANGDTFDQDGYTAALLPRSRWHAARLGTRVQLTHDGNTVVVEINDRGAGDGNPNSTRALDLSRAAASALTGRDINNDGDARNVGLIRLDKIEVVSRDTPLGPVEH